MKRIAVVILAVALGGCASSRSGKSDQGPSTNQAETPANEKVTELAAQTLAPGACGLFLWTQDDPRRFVFFQEAGSPVAKLAIGDAPIEVKQTAQSGDIFGQFMTKLTFADASGRTVRLSLQPGEELDGGQRVPAAQIATTNADGWEVFIPVSGVTACQPE